MNRPVAVAFIVLILASLGVGYVMGNSTRLTLTSTQTSTSIKTTTMTSREITTITSVQTVKTILTVANTTSAATAEAPIPIANVETGNVSIGASFDTIAVNPDTNRIYVAGGTNILTVVDAVSHEVVANVTLPVDSNSGIAIDNATGMVYVLVQGGIAEINGTTNAVVGELPINFGFRSIAYDRATDTVYGSTENAGGEYGYLVGVSATTGIVTANISIGYWASDILVNAKSNLIYAIGCASSFVCDSVVSVVNGTSTSLVNETYLRSPYYATATINEETGFVYVSGEAQLAVLSPLGTVIYNGYPDTCGSFIAMTVDPSLNQVILAPQNYDYLLVYNGEYGNLVNMYSLPDVPQYVAFNPNTSETYFIVDNSLLSFHDNANIGHVNGTLIGEDQFCLPV